MKAYDKAARAAGKDRPFFARLLEDSTGKAADGTKAKDKGNVTTKKAGKGGNDVDQDGDQFQRPPVGGGRPPMTTMKAGKGGNDVDHDVDQTPVRPQPPMMTTMKAGKCGNDCDSDADVG